MRELEERKREKKRRKESAGAAPPMEALAAAREAQARAREARGKELAASGASVWLAGLLPIDGGALALEIGTNGESTLALRARGFRVITIDENPLVLDARSTLLRGRARAVSPSAYAIEYGALPERLADGVTAIEADLVVEPSLGDALVYAGPFDAVIVSADDAHAARFANAAIATRGVRDQNRYRGETFKRAYELADKILYSDGVLQIVHTLDNAVGEETAREVVRLHAELSRGTAMRFDRLDVREQKPTMVAVRARKSG
jgi:hypothetical protein